MKQEQALLRYNEAVLGKLKKGEEKLDSIDNRSDLLPLHSPTKYHHAKQEHCEESSGRFLGKSRMTGSLISEVDSIPYSEKSTTPNHDMEYLMLSNDINKLLSKLAKKDSQKKTMNRTGGFVRSGSSHTKKDKFLPV